MRIKLEDRSGNEIELVVHPNGQAILSQDGCYVASVRWDKTLNSISFTGLPDKILSDRHADDDIKDPQLQIPSEQEGLIFMFEEK